MLMKVGLCASAIEEISEKAGPQYAKIVHAAVAEFFAAHGQLVMSNKSEIQDVVRLATASSSLEPGARQAWSLVIQELYKQGRIRVPDPGARHSLAEISTTGQLSETWTAADMPVLAMVPEVLIRNLFPSTLGTVTDPSTGILLASSADFLDSEPIRGLKELLAESRLPLGATRKEYWERVLNPLVQTSKQVTIFDRYLFSELLRRSQTSSSPNEPDEALVWIMRMLDKYGNDGIVVRLFGATASNGQHPDSVEHAARLLRAAWVRSTPGAIAQVDLVAGPWKQRGKKMAHDRHLRFGGTRAISLPAGLDMLKAPVIVDEVGMEWNYKWKAPGIAPLIASERQLESAPFTGVSVL